MLARLDEADRAHQPRCIDAARAEARAEFRRLGLGADQAEKAHVAPPQHWPSASPSANFLLRCVSPDSSISRAILSAVYSRLPPPIVPCVSVALTHMRVPASRGAEPRVSSTRISMSEGMQGLEDVFRRRWRFERHRVR